MKNLAKDERGLTLIELVVVMVISVILMGIAGSIILSSTGFFTKVTISDQDKLATDKLVEFVDGEIMYATNVIVSEQEPRNLKEIKSDNWHYFLFDKGRVYIGTVFYDGNEKFYRNSESIDPLTDSYYNNRELVVDAKGYSNSYRLDLTFSFNNQDGETEYKTKSTIAFPNLKLQYDSATTKKGWFDSVDYSSRENNKFFYIYYTKDAIAVDTGTGYGGTVADQIQCKQKIGDYDNDKGMWKQSIGHQYKKGDFVFICSDTSAGEKCKEEDKVWYRLFKADGGMNPASTGGDNPWKRITAEFMPASTYYRGDVVKLTNKKKIDVYYMYFGAKTFTGQGAIPTYHPGKENSLWAPIRLNTELVPYCETKYDSGDSRYKNSFIIGSHAELLSKWGIDVEELKDAKTYSNDEYYPSVLSEYNNNTITLRDIVQYKEHYYLNLSDYHLRGVSPDEKDKDDRVWYRIDSDFGENNIYNAGDIVIYYYSSTAGLFRAKGSITSSENPIKSDEWEKVYYDYESEEYKVTNKNNY